VADEAGLRSVVRVCVSSSKAERSVPCIGSRNIPRAKRQDLCLCSNASSKSSIVGTADIAELVADPVGDDVWVECFLLSLVDRWVDGLEGELSVLAAVETSFELDGWDAGAEVEACNGGGLDGSAGGGRWGSSGWGGGGCRGFRHGNERGSCTVCRG
jgi:hypothetical protein